MNEVKLYLFEILILDPLALKLDLGPNRFFYPNVKLCKDCKQDINSFEENSNKHEKQLDKGHKYENEMKQQY